MTLRKKKPVVRDGEDNRVPPDEYGRRQMWRCPGCFFVLMYMADEEKPWKRCPRCESIEPGGISMVRLTPDVEIVPWKGRGDGGAN